MKSCTYTIEPREEERFPSLTSPPLLKSNHGVFLCRTAVFIDGGNLYRRLKDLNIKSTGKFDYMGLIRSLANNDRLVYVGYYVGQVKIERENDKSTELHANQQRLFASLEKSIPNIKIVKGRIQNFKGLYKEKGVDVRLALDIYRLANENLYDKALIISSDSDLIPAIELVKTMENKTVEYIGFSNRSSIELMRKCHSKQILDYSYLKQFEYC